MSEASVLLSLADGIARITLNRPETGNAIDLVMAQAMLRAAIACDQDHAVRCVVVSGTGRMFCAGGDIAEFQAAGEAAGAYLSKLAGTMTLALSRLVRMDKPLLILVNGPAAGAGLSLALAGDIVLAGSAAHFTSAYTAIGLVPDCGLTWWLPRVVGLRKAQEMIVTNRRICAQEAVRIGLVTQVVDDLELAGRASAAALSASPVHAVSVVRQLLLNSFSASFETQCELEGRAIAAAGVGLEGKEGVAAFLAKRKPDFHGV